LVANWKLLCRRSDLLVLTKEGHVGQPRSREKDF
jgi:hypothetical protein